MEKIAISSEEIDRLVEFCIARKSKPCAVEAAKLGASTPIIDRFLSKLLDKPRNSWRKGQDLSYAVALVEIGASAHMVIKTLGFCVEAGKVEFARRCAEILGRKLTQDEVDTLVKAMPFPKAALTWANRLKASPEIKVALRKEVRIKKLESTIESAQRELRDLGVNVRVRRGPDHLSLTG